MTEQQTKELNALKAAHDHFATAVQILTTRVQFYQEEFQGVANVTAFLTTLRDDARRKIEEIEPPAPKPKEVFDMDLTHVKAEKPEVTAELNS